ncbi:MAG: 23S rRNA (uracil(1939)-C(5))-methyltransferase RlmD [Bacillota bacterium]|nr:23S rRNA (uracil(1939)-C(5))-methyltransferase RlmD [Bacillota bacterium]
MAKCKVLVDLLAEYQKKYEGKPAPYEASIGCELYFIPYEEQLAFKKEYVRRLFQNKGFEIDLNTVHASPVITGYRNKMEYSFGDTSMGGELNLGLHVPGRFYDIESTTELDMVDEDFNKIVSEVQTYVRAKGYKKFYKKDASGLLRNLIIRKGKFTGEILIGISTTYEDFDTEDFVDFLLGLKLAGRIVGILHLKNDSNADVVKQGMDDKLLYGRDYYVEKILGLEFKVSFFSFFQTNSECTEVLYSRVRDFVLQEKPKKALDLFCGTGTISQVLSGELEQVTGIEIIEDAVIMAGDNASINGITNCRYICGDVFKVLKDKAVYGDLSADLIILDPPRSGVSKKALEKIIGLGVDKILYVSCNPRTLAIDYEMLHEAGYRISKIEAVDMYPMTKHVECIALIQRVKL